MGFLFELRLGGGDGGTIVEECTSLCGRSGSGLLVVGGTDLEYPALAVGTAVEESALVWRYSTGCILLLERIALEKSVVGGD